MIEPILLNKPCEADQVMNFAKQCINPDGEGYCIIRNLAFTPAELLQLVHEKIAASFTLSVSGNKQLIYDKVQDKGYERHDTSTILSATHLAFPLHTDCSYLQRPADVVTLYCEANAQQGGESILLHIRELIRLLPPDYIAFLLTTTFSFQGTHYPILEKKGDHYFIRFSIVEMNAGMSAEDMKRAGEQLTPLLELLSDHALYKTVMLEPGDCLIVNNRSALHGRTAFEGKSNRLFYRMRQYT